MLTNQSKISNTGLISFHKHFASGSSLRKVRVENFKMDPHWSKKTLSWEEGAAEKSCYGLTPFPIPHPLCSLGVEGGGLRNKGMKMALEGGEKEGIFMFTLCFSPPKSLLNSNKLNKISPSLFCPWQQLMSDLAVFILSLKFFYCLPPALLRKGSE